MQEDEATLRYSTAKGYIQACKMIVLSEHYASNIITVVLPMHMLAAFGLELYLKAWLLRAGIKSKVVRGYGHSVEGLYVEAKRLALPEIDKLQEMKDHFAGPHSDFTYRYISPGAEMDNTNWLLAFDVFDELDVVVDKFIGASVSHGLQPGH